MAFENVFGNIDFMSPVRSEIAQANQFQQMLGNAISNYQENKRYEEQMDLKRKEIEAKGYDPKILAQNAAMKIEMGMGDQVTPQERAALSFQAKAPPTIYTDEFQNRVVVPNRYQTYSQGVGGGVQSPMIGGATMASPQEEMVINQMMGQQAPMPSPDTRLSVDMLQGMDTQVPPMDASQFDTVPYNAPQDVVSDERGQEYNLTPQPSIISQTPFGVKEAYGEAKEISKEERAFQRQKKIIEFQKKLESKKESADLLLQNQNAIPLIEEMIKNNRITIDMPYAEMLKLPTRLLDSDAATALDLVNQNRLELAAPLAKQLGVNPTDKDFQASLDRIVDLNASKESREKQLLQLKKRIEGKIGARQDQTSSKVRKRYNPQTGQLEVVQ